MKEHTAKKIHKERCAWDKCPRPEIRPGDRYRLVMVHDGHPHAYGSSYQGMRSAKFHLWCWRAERDGEILKQAISAARVRAGNFSASVKRAKEALS
jgi:hypothetical protein